MKALFAKKPIRITAVAVGIAAVLAAAFFLAPGTGPAPGTGREPAVTAASAVSVTETTLAAAPTAAREVLFRVELPELEPSTTYAETETVIYSEASSAAETTITTAASGSVPASTAATTITTTTTISTTTIRTSLSTSTSAFITNKTSAAPAAKYTYANATAGTTTTARPASSVASAAAATTSRAAATTTTTTTAAAQFITTRAQPTATLSIRCDTAASNPGKLRAGRNPPIPANGIIMAKKTVTFTEGETVFDILRREIVAEKMHWDYTSNPMFNSVYIEGINNLYEFDFGELSGWMYRVNDRFPQYGCSSYRLKHGDAVEWLYTCDLGEDIGGGYAAGTQR